MTTFTIDDRTSLRAPLLFAAIVLVGFGLLYSLAGTGLGRLLFPRQATGSLIVSDGKTLGSELVAQPFSGDRYFQSRPSASNYDPMAAGGSNQARSNPNMRKRVNEAIAAVAAREG
ncbi:MAG TPA: potassium-transporting ATPase subunit C, partial [Lysobacter sp.]|nr:potassium-transporting ATPase subunit C [Lysobacter sp.]